MTRNNAKILIADDNIDIREMLKDVLAEKGYMVETVENGYELLGYLKKKSPPNVIILDLMMPEKNGIEVLSAVKELSPDTRIIIYTGFQRCKDPNYANIVDRFLIKSEKIEILLQAIEELT